MNKRKAEMMSNTSIADSRCMLRIGDAEYFCELGNIDRNGAYLRSTTPTILKDALADSATLYLFDRGAISKQLDCHLVYIRGVPHLDGVAVAFENQAVAAPARAAGF